MRDSQKSTGLRAVLAATFLLLSAACAGQHSGPSPSLAGSPAPRAVVAYATRVGDLLAVQQSPDGVSWTEPVVVRDLQGNMFRTLSAPAIAWDGHLYHLAWFDSAHALQYAVSGNLTDWAIQSQPVGNFPSDADSAPTIAAGANEVLIAFRTPGDEALVVGIDGSVRGVLPVSTPYSGPAIVYGSNQFLAAVSARNSTRIFSSADGRTWTDLATLPGADPQPALAHNGSNFLLASYYSRGAGAYRLKLSRSLNGRDWDEEIDVGPIAISAVTAGIFADPANQFLLAYWRSVSTWAEDGAEHISYWYPGRGVSLTRGPGEHLAAVQLKTLRVDRSEDPNGDEPFLVIFPFKLRVQQPGSLQVHWPGYLSELGRDIESGEPALIVDSRMGAAAWTVDDPQLNVRELEEDPNQRIDVLGMGIVAMESDGCSFDLVSNLVRNALPLVSNVLEQKIVPATVPQLLNRSDRDRIMQDVKTEMDEQLQLGRLLGGGVGPLNDIPSCAIDPEDIIGMRTLIIVGFPSEDLDEPESLVFFQRQPGTTVPVSIEIVSSSTGPSWTLTGEITFR